MSYTIDELRDRVEKYKQIKSILVKKNEDTGESVMDRWKELDPDTYRQWYELNQCALSLAYYSAALSEGSKQLQYRKLINEHIKTHQKDIFLPRFKYEITEGTIANAINFFDMNEKNFMDEIKDNPDEAFKEVFIKVQERLDGAFSRLKNTAIAGSGELQKYGKKYDIEDVLKLTDGYFDILHKRYSDAREYVYSLSDPPDVMKDLVDSEDHTIDVKDELMNMVDADRFGKQLEALIFQVFGDEYIRMKAEVVGFKTSNPILKKENADFIAENNVLRAENEKLKAKNVELVEAGNVAREMAANAEDFTKAKMEEAAKWEGFEASQNLKGRGFELNEVKPSKIEPQVTYAGESFPEAQVSATELPVLAGWEIIGEKYYQKQPSGKYAVRDRKKQIMKQITEEDYKKRKNDAKS